jgi:hypothetical protein
LPYTVGRVDLPTAQEVEVVPRLQVYSRSQGVGPSTTTMTKDIGSVPFMDRNATFTVRIIRRFTAAKSGKLIGTVDESYVLCSAKMTDKRVCLTLLK